MKIILLIIFVITFSPVRSSADCAKGADVAAKKFINDYIDHLQHSFKDKGPIERDQWVETNPQITTNFKSSYRAIIDKARKTDPVLGLNADPILDAQDYPDEGVVVDQCKEPDYVTLKGNKWKEFKIVVRVIRVKDVWMMEGAGIVNIPEDKQVSRR